MATTKTVEAQDVKSANVGQFNVWEYVYKKLATAYVANGETSNFTCGVHRMDDYQFMDEEGRLIALEGCRKVFKYLNKLGALEITEIKETYQEDGKRVYEVAIKDFNVKTEVDGKYGKRKLFAKHYGNAKLQ